MTWSRLQENDKDNDTLIYYMASAHFNKGEFEGAIPYFSSIIENDTSIFKDKALWYLGLSYLQLDRTDDFNALTPNQSSVYSTRFDEIKERLNK